MKFMSSKDTGEECLMHSKRDNLETIIHDKRTFWSLLSRYQNRLEKPMRCIAFNLDYDDFIVLQMS